MQLNTVQNVAPPPADSRSPAVRLGEEPSTRRAYRHALRERRTDLVFGAIVMVVQSLAVLPVPLILRYAVDDAIPNKSTARLLAAAGGIVGLNLLTRVAAVASQHWVQRATKHATSKLRERVGGRVFRTDFAYLGDLDGALIHERMIGDPGRIEQQFTTALRVFLPNLMMVVGLLAILFSMDPLLTLVSATIVPAMVVSIRAFRPMLERSLKTNQVAFETLARKLLLSVRAQAFMRARGTAGTEQRGLDEAIHIHKEASAARVTSVGFSQAVHGTLVGLASAATLTVGGQAVISGRISLGSMLSFFAGFALLRGPIASLASCSPQFIEGRQASDRVDVFLRSGFVGAEVSTAGSSGSLTLTTLSLDGVTFRYPGSAPIVDNFSLVLDPGRIVALAGPNGSGKTTLLGLLLGLLTPESGTARADGVALADLRVDLNALRSQVGVAFQHAEFLPGTVRDNVRYGRPGVDDDQLALALSEAEADSVVASLANGIDTWIGDDGDRLSGGERQRLAIARAIIGRPRLVILDEPNNHLPDTVIERILARLAGWEHPPAVLLISHDAVVLGLADETIRLNRPEQLSVVGEAAALTRAG